MLKKSARIRLGKLRKSERKLVFLLLFSFHNEQGEIFARNKVPWVQVSHGEKKNTELNSKQNVLSRFRKPFDLFSDNLPWSFHQLKKKVLLYI